MRPVAARTRVSKWNGRAILEFLPPSLADSAKHIEAYYGAFAAYDVGLLDIASDDVSHSVLSRCIDLESVSRAGTGDTCCSVAAAKALRLLSEGALSVPNMVAMNHCLAGNGGGVRAGPMWVGAPNPGDAWYVAPPANLVPSLLLDLVRFCIDERVPLTLRASVGFNQLLLIHPFRDGNGRTARALFPGASSQAL